MEHRIATPQIVLNYALYLQVPVQRREGLGNLQVQWSYWVIGISYRYTSFFRFCFRFRGGGVSRKDSVGVKERVLAHPLPPPLNAPPLSSLLWGGKRGCSPLRCRPPSTPLPLLPSVLQENKFWEDSFQVYERGVALFKYPHVKEIWQAYLKHFVER